MRTMKFEILSRFVLLIKSDVVWAGPKLVDQWVPFYRG